jgi:hypothetical protein
MPVVQDLLWKNPGNPGMIVIPGHAALSEDGSLFLGYGDAAEAARRIPGIEEECGRVVSANTVEGVYGFLPVRPSRPVDRLIGFGLFQTHLSLEEKADPGLIHYSMECLRQYTEENPNLRVRMSLPGVGEPGGLTAEDVTPLLIPLPPNVTVCHLGEIRRSVPDTFIGFKAVYIQIENMLRDGLYNQAVEYLVQSGFDLQSATEQVSAVQRVLKERGGGPVVKKPVKAHSARGESFF